MTATATRITCSECGCDLTDPDEQRTGMCTDDLARWFAETVIDIPNRQHPTSHDINRIVAKHTAIGSAIRAMERHASGADYIEDDDVDLDEPVLSTTTEVQAHLVEHQAWQHRAHPKDAAHEAAHGYDPEWEAQQEAAEDAEVCEICGGTGWQELPAVGFDIECVCQAVS